MSQHVITDLRRELEKTRLALVAAQTHLAAHAEANAALHMAATVMYSPLHAHVTAAIAGAADALQRSDAAAGEARRAAELAAVLTGLERIAERSPDPDSRMWARGAIHTLARAWEPDDPQEVAGVPG